MANGSGYTNNESALRLSHFVIVDSVLKETSIDPRIGAMLPVSLNNIYQKFISNTNYTDNFRAKDEFYLGIGLLGIGVEERIFNRRLLLEKSLKRGFRLRGNPKSRRSFDGVLINRYVKKVKVNCNLFTIGNHGAGKIRRPRTRQTGRKKSVTVKRNVELRPEDSKKPASESPDSSDGNETEDRSIALSRTKRLKKVPHLDFKYCYNDSGTVRVKRGPEIVKKEDQFMEIVDDSDSSSVIEVSPPAIDKENSESNVLKTVTKKRWHPRENKALNLLDKLRLGLQCTVIQTEHDVIIQHLTMEDLSTLRRRLQGLATFKNIEAEYDKNGQETARATIDRRVLNLPARNHGDYHCESRRIAPESLQLKKIETKKSANEFSSNWRRPKVRSVKKIRKLYTQASSTPNILARSQTPARTENCSSRATNKSQLSTSDMSGSVSFYPQITTNVTEPMSICADNKMVKTEQRVPSSESGIVTEAVASVEQSIGTMVTTSATMSNSGTPATAMSASQLLMLKKGGAHTTTTESSSPSTSTLSMTRKDQLFANQILKPFKKTITASSPSKLELDDEETDFELTPSLIAQAKTIDLTTINSLHNKVPLITKPLIQTSGPGFSFPSIVSNCVRTIHLTTNNALFHSHNSGASHSTTTTTTTFSANRLAPSSNLPLTHSSPLSLPHCTDIIGPMGSNLKIKHRKWTHNFLTSNSINFREVLCSPAAAATAVVVAKPSCSSSLSSSSLSLSSSEAACHPHHPHHRSRLSPLVNSGIQSIVSRNTAVTVTTKPLIVASTIVNPHRPVSVPTTATTNVAKGSSVVLKSLLVGSNSANDLCHLNNKSHSWSSTYLSANCPTQNSKIKWQVGGSVVASQAGLVATNNNTNNNNNNNNGGGGGVLCKENNKSLESVVHADNIE